jgi:nitric oxide reductase activation protein
VTGDQRPRERRNQMLAELADDENDANGAMDIFSSPVGGGGLLGRLLQKMLGAMRRLGEGGSPGIDTPTHRARSGTRGGANAVFSSRRTGAFEDEPDGGRGTKYPEWDVYRRRYRPNWCTVQEVQPRPTDETSPGLSVSHGLRRPLARLGIGLDRYHRQVQGDDIDIDAAVEARVEVMAGSAPDEAVYLDSLRRRRDLSVLLLLDVSGSVAEPGAIGQTVHEQQRAAAAALTAALHDLGDRVALFAFHSYGRSAVHLMPVKRFDDDLDALVMRRLHGLVPGAYSRLGAAIRHGATALERHGGTTRRLLVVLSDGLAYDHGYERAYGAADARRALAEARRRGIGCLCLTIGAGTDVDDLRRVFGSAAHATIPRLEQLSQIIGPLFGSALRSAEARRRVPTRKGLAVNPLHRQPLGVERL